MTSIVNIGHVARAGIIERCVAGLFLLLVLGALISSQPAKAGQATGLVVNALIVQPLPVPNALSPPAKNRVVALVTVSGAHQNKPGCATLPSRFAFDPTTPVGKAMWQLVALAAATQRTINFQGHTIRGNLGTCELWGDTETAEWAVMN